MLSGELAILVGNVKVELNAIREVSKWWAMLRWNSMPSGKLASGGQC